MILTDGYLVGTSDFFEEYSKNLGQYEEVRGKFSDISSNGFHTEYSLRGDNDTDFNFKVRSSLGYPISKIFGVSSERSLKGMVCQIYCKDGIFKAIAPIHK